MRKSAKQAAWIAIGLWTGFTFVGYFTPIRGLAAAVTSFSLGPWESFWVLFYGFATYGNAGFMREQVCKYMCPYGVRFSGARSGCPCWDGGAVCHVGPGTRMVPVHHSAMVFTNHRPNSFASLRFILRNWLETCFK